jgi:hypothetical protein
MHIAYWDNVDYTDVSQTTMGDSCVVHDPDGEGEDERFWGQYIKLWNMEEPGDGYNTWSLNIVMDNIVPGETPDLNMDLVDSGDDSEGTWFDAAWEYIGGDPNARPLRNIRYVGRSRPDMGVYGGPYARNNFWYADGDWSSLSEWDFIVVSDRDFFNVDPPWEHYILCIPDLERVGPGVGETFCVSAGSFIECGDYVIDVAGAIQINGQPDSMAVTFVFEDGGYFSFDDTTDVVNSNFNNCQIIGGDYGLYLAGVDNTSGDRLDIDNCLLYSCETGIYANDSRVEITNTEISECTGNGSSSYGNAIYLTNCSSGQVIVDGCDIHDNGYDGTYSSAAIYLNSSDAEIINTEVYDNSGVGVACFGSSPDLDAYDYPLAEELSNEIRDNGPASPVGSDGAEIYLDVSSAPVIKYNNIFDCVTSPSFDADGYAVYMEYSNPNNITATYNWWGTNSPNTYENDLFYDGSGSVGYTPWASSGYTIDDYDEFTVGMRLWDAGEYESAARIFRRTVNDTGAVGINSVHYLTGCVGEMERGDFADLRDFLIGVAEEHRDAHVAHVAERWSTHCLTEMGEYEDAMAEYLGRAQNAECLRDSVAALIDYLAVLELAEGVNRGASSGLNFMEESQRLMELLKNGGGEAEVLPADFAIVQAYPNPFNSATKIMFNLQEEKQIKIAIHDIQGREITVLYEGLGSPGDNCVIWDASSLPSGIYLCRLDAGEKVNTVKLALTR